MRVLSLFDGISVARVALERAGLPVEAYYASEVDKYATAVSAKNYPDIIRLGDVRSVGKVDCDLLIGGSPCQDLSVAKKDRKGLDGERSGLFWEFVRILKESKPRWFVLENVNSMPKDAKQIITETLGVEPLMIDASLVSAQSRKRLFWTNIPVTKLPEDRKLFLKDFLVDGYAGTDKAYALTASDAKGISERYYHQKHKRNLVYENQSVFQWRRSYWRERMDGKSPTLTANMGTGGNNVPYVGYDGKPYRKFYPVECERLQGLPDGYTEGVSNSQRYKAIGNAFNADVVAHILSFIPQT